MCKPYCLCQSLVELQSADHLSPFPSCGGRICRSRQQQEPHSLSDLRFLCVEQKRYRSWALYHACDVLFFLHSYRKVALTAVQASPGSPFNTCTLISARDQPNSKGNSPKYSHVMTHVMLTWQQGWSAPICLSYTQIWTEILEELERLSNCPLSNWCRRRKTWMDTSIHSCARQFLDIPVTFIPSERWHHTVRTLSRQRLVFHR